MLTSHYLSEFHRSLPELPGPIDNSSIVHARNGQLQLRQSSGYGHISEDMWCFLHRRYGGGPAMISISQRLQLSRHASPVPKVEGNKEGEEEEEEEISRSEEKEEEEKRSSESSALTDWYLLPLALFSSVLWHDVVTLFMPFAILHFVCSTSSFGIIHGSALHRPFSFFTHVPRSKGWVPRSKSFSRNFFICKAL